MAISLISSRSCVSFSRDQASLPPPPPFPPQPPPPPPTPPPPPDCCECCCWCTEQPDCIHSLDADSFSSNVFRAPWVSSAWSSMFTVSTESPETHFRSSNGAIIAELSPLSPDDAKVVEVLLPLELWCSPMVFRWPLFNAATEESSVVVSIFGWVFWPDALFVRQSDAVVESPAIVWVELPLSNGTLEVVWFVVAKLCMVEYRCSCCEIDVVVIVVDDGGCVELGFAVVVAVWATVVVVSVSADVELVVWLWFGATESYTCLLILLCSACVFLVGRRRSFLISARRSAATSLYHSWAREERNESQTQCADRLDLDHRI